MTGQQGGSVAKAICEHPVLLQRYTVRGVTRDPTSLPARELVDRYGCEVVKADLDDKSSIKSAIAGATGIFLVTSSVYDDRLYEREVSQGKAVADAARMPVSSLSSLAHSPRCERSPMANTST